jgi:tetratricopeptide (TPR) repeat protein
LNPDYAEAYKWRGIAHKHKGQNELSYKDNADVNRLKCPFRSMNNIVNNMANRVINNCTEVIKLEPDNAEAYMERGNAYSRIGQNEDAIKDLKMALNIDPNFTEAQESLAKLGLCN